MTWKKLGPRTVCTALVPDLADTLQHCCKYVYHLCTVWFCPIPGSPLVQTFISQAVLYWDQCWFLLIIMLLCGWKLPFKHYKSSFSFFPCLRFKPYWNCLLALIVPCHLIAAFWTFGSSSVRKHRDNREHGRLACPKRIIACSKDIWAFLFPSHMVFFIKVCRGWKLE